MIKIWLADERVKLLVSNLMNIYLPFIHEMNIRDLFSAIESAEHLSSGRDQLSRKTKWTSFEKNTHLAKSAFSRGK